MPDRLDRLEQTLKEVVRSVSDLEARFAALEGATSGQVRPDTGTPVSVEPGPPEPKAAGSPAAPGNLATRLPLVGRTFLVLGGAFLLRALTNSGTLPEAAGVSFGLLYALVWLGFAHREARKERSESAAFHGLASVLVAYPLLFESATRFDVLSPFAVGTAVILTTAIGLGVAWRGHLSAVAWWFTLAPTTTLVALQFAAGRPILFSAFLIVVGVATLLLAYTRGWGGQRWLVAIPTNLAVLRAVFVVAPDRGAAEVVPTLGPQVLIVLFLLSYLASFAVLTLARRREVGAFEIVQSAAVLLVGIGGAVHVTRAAGSGGGLVGVSALVVGAMCYAAAFAFVRRRLGRGRNFFFYSSLGLVLVLTGSRLLGLDGFCTITYGVLAVVAAFLGGRFDRVTLRAHSAVYAFAAALQSGLLSITAGALVGSVSDPYRDSPWALPALLFITLAYSSLVATRAFRTAPRLARIPRLVLAFVSLLGVTALLVFLVVQVVPEGAAEDRGFVAAIRTAVLAVAAVALAFARRRVGLLELGWLSVFLLSAGALKLVLEDLRAGGASALFVAFAFYGIALILVPRLLRVPRAEA